ANRPPAYIETVSRAGYRFIAPVRAIEPQPGAALTTVAVLPFRPLVAEARDAALEMGIADSLIARLGADAGFVVRSLSAVRKYAALEQDPVSAGRELRVRFVLDGTIQRAGDTLRITVRLLRVADGRASWSGTFDQPFTDIFAIEDAISERVTTALRP